MFMKLTPGGQPKADTNCQTTWVSDGKNVNQQETHNLFDIVAF